MAEYQTVQYHFRNENTPVDSEIQSEVDVKELKQESDDESCHLTKIKTGNDDQIDDRESFLMTTTSNVESSVEQGLGVSKNIVTRDSPRVQHKSQLNEDQPSSTSGLKTMKSELKVEVEECPDVLSNELNIDDERYRCGQCEQDFESMIHLVEHCEMKHDGTLKEEEGELCDSTVVERLGYVSHPKSNRGESSQIWDIASRTQSSIIGQQSDTTKLKCSCCDFTAGQVHGLVDHFIFEHGKQTLNSNSHPIKSQMFRCANCDYSTSVKQDFTRHECEHDREKFKCNLCHYAASLRHNFIRHIKSVHDNKKFKCNNCTYATSYKCTFIRHVKRSHDKAKFECSLCDFSTRVVQKFVHHVRRTHDNDKFKCNLCDYASVSKAYFVHHVRSVHENDRFECSRCDYSTTVESRLKSHVEDNHDVSGDIFDLGNGQASQMHNSSKNSDDNEIIYGRMASRRTYGPSTKMKKEDNKNII